MDTLTYSEARSKLANTMDKVCDDHAPIIITRKNSQSVVMMSLDDYQALEETAYLLRSLKMHGGFLSPSLNSKPPAGLDGNCSVDSSVFRECVGRSFILAANRQKYSQADQCAD